MKRSLTPIEAAAKLKVSRRTIYNMLDDGRLRTAEPDGIKRNVRATRVDAASVAEFAAQVKKPK